MNSGKTKFARKYTDVIVIAPEKLAQFTHIIRLIESSDNEAAIQQINQLDSDTLLSFSQNSVLFSEFCASIPSKLNDPEFKVYAAQILNAEKWLAEIVDEKPLKTIVRLLGADLTEVIKPFSFKKHLNKILEDSSIGEASKKRILELFKGSLTDKIAGKLEQGSYPSQDIISVDSKEKIPMFAHYMGSLLLKYFQNQDDKNDAIFLDEACMKGLYHALLMRVNVALQLVNIPFGKNHNEREQWIAAIYLSINSDLDRLSNLYWGLGYVSAVAMRFKLIDQLNSSPNQAVRIYNALVKIVEDFAKAEALGEYTISIELATAIFPENGMLAGFEEGSVHDWESAKEYLFAELRKYDDLILNMNYELADVISPSEAFYLKMALPAKREVLKLADETLKAIESAKEVSIEQKESADTGVSKQGKFFKNKSIEILADPAGYDKSNVSKGI